MWGSWKNMVYFLRKFMFKICKSQQYQGLVFLVDLFVKNDRKYISSNEKLLADDCICGLSAGLIVLAWPSPWYPWSAEIPLQCALICPLFLQWNFPPLLISSFHTKTISTRNSSFLHPWPSFWSNFLLSTWLFSVCSHFFIIQHGYHLMVFFYLLW